MSYLTVAPFSRASLGYSPLQIGLHFILPAMFFGLGGAVGGILGKKISDNNVLRLASLIMLCGSVLFALVLANYQASLTIYHYMLPFSLLTFTFTFGIVIPTGSVVAIQYFREISGTCSSGMNFMTSLLAFVTTLTVSLLYEMFHDVAMTTTLLICAAISLTVLFVIRDNTAKKFHNFSLTRLLNW